MRIDRLVLASGNPGKIQEFKALLSPYEIDLVSQNELGILDPAETGETFVENAIIKARHAAMLSGLPALADDSGLCVDSMNGAPGVISARYAGELANADDNIDKLLAEMTQQQNRVARFVSVLVLMRSACDPLPLIAIGEWRGSILRERRGTGGFGYDAVFYDPLLGKSAAELAPEIKNAVSHRGKAMKELKAVLDRTNSTNI